MESNGDKLTAKPNEEAGYELDYTRSASYVQSDPVESER